MKTYRIKVLTVIGVKQTIILRANNKKEAEKAALNQSGIVALVK